MSREKTPESILRKLSVDGPRGADGTFLEKDGSVTVGGPWEKPAEYPSKRKFAPHAEDDDEMIDEEVQKPTKQERKELMEKAVENDGPVPLIPNLDANARHVIVAIRVNKRTPPNDGIKGDVPASTSLDFIARRWGDGIYDFEGLNEAGQVLRRNANAKISMGYFQGNDGNGTPKQISVPISSDNLSEKILSRLDTESERSHKYAEQALSTTQQLSQNYASMIREDSNLRSARDREYFQAQSEQNGNFFQTVLVSMQTMHEQSMQQQRESFQQTIQMMQMSHQQTMTMNNPTFLLSLFERGLRFGAEQTSDSEDSPLATVLGAGVAGLREIKELSMLQHAQTPATLPSGAPSSLPAPKGQSEKKSGKVTKLISKPELLEVLKLKKIAERKGYDFDSLLKQAQMMISNAPQQESSPNPSDPPEDDEETEEDTESDSE